MANKEQLAILKQGVAAWNKWREENPDAKIDLRGAKMNGLDLSGANFQHADVRGTSFKKAMLTGANFGGSRFTSSDSYVLYDDYFYVEPTYGLLDNSHENLSISIYENTILADDDVRKLLVRGNRRGISLKGKNLKGAYLVGFDLCDTDLRETNFVQANLSGAKLYGSARENWIIDGIRCDYIYWDEAGEQRTPPDRDFRPGEFEELYKQVPTFEYVFANGFTPLDPLIMDRVVQAVNERHKEFSLELVNFDKRGQPHATFTVCRLDYVDAAKGQLAALYEKTITYLMKENEDKKRIIDRMNDFVDQLLNKIPSIEGVKMGDTIYNISGGQIAAVGTNASASGNTFQQITAELSRVHEEMQRNAKTPEQRAAADDVVKAAQAAQQQNEPAVRQHLKNAGKFALDCAKTVGTDVAAEFLKKAMGI